MSFTILNVNKLYREDGNPLYYGVICYEEFSKWPLDKLRSLKYNDDLLQINCENILEHESSLGLSIELNKPVLNGFPYKSRPKDEFLISIKEFNIVNLLLNELLTEENFSQLIEVRNSSVSKHSLRVMTIQSLEKILIDIFQNMSFTDYESMLPTLKTYIQNFIQVNINYFPSNMREFLNIREKTIIHTTNTWYIIFRYFFDQWQKGSNIKVPKLGQPIIFENWSGIFFDRENPIWTAIYSKSKRLHYPSYKYQNKIYKEWLKLIKFS